MAWHGSGTSKEAHLPVIVYHHGLGTSDRHSGNEKTTKNI